MREGETGGARVAFEKSFLHKEVCFFCREEMPVDDDLGCSQRDEIGPAYGERIGQAIHGEAVREDGSTGTGSYRDR